MGQTYYFYDLETSSGSPRDGRIMQFAGQRTDVNLEPVGEPDNLLVKLADDVLPEPDAVLVHGITPQKTLQEGLTEVEFIRYFHENVALADTIFIGYNNIRFDDEFMRRACYRTFYDPYQWHWKDGRSRFDLLDPIRMMRALRPDGMKWPFADGKPTVKLELMAAENGFDHDNAHDALSDVRALIQIAQAFHAHQPKLFDWLLSTRDKASVAKVALSDSPFVYTSGKYSSDYEKTTLVHTLFKHPRREAAIVYNLREDPSEWFDKSVDELVVHWQVRYGDETKPLPVKTMQFNRCPAVAPAGVLDAASQERIGLDMTKCEEHRTLLTDNPEFIGRLKDALDVIEKEQQARLIPDEEVDKQIYDGFWSEGDQIEMRKIRAAAPEELVKNITGLRNRRLREMLPLYVARNYPKVMSDDLRGIWEKHRQAVFYGGGGKSRFARFGKRMQELAKNGLSKDQEYLLTELQLYVESVLPEPVD